MPIVSFNFTAAQAARIQEAADLYNLARGTAWTTKEFVFNVCVKPQVVELLRAKAATTAGDTNKVTVTADLESGTP